MSYADDELDSRAPGRREDAADEAARIEDQAAPHVVHLGSNSALANQLNAQFNQLTAAALAHLTSIARFHGQPLRVTPAVRSEILAAIESLSSSGSHMAAAMPGTVEVITVEPGQENVIYADGEWHFLLPAPPEPTEDQALAAKLANLSRLADMVNATGAAFAALSTVAATSAEACRQLAEEVQRPDADEVG